MFKRIKAFANQAFVESKEIFRHTFSKDSTVIISEEVLADVNIPELLLFIKKNRPCSLTMDGNEAYKAIFEDKLLCLFYSRDRVYVYHYDFKLEDNKYYAVTTNKGELYLLRGDKLSFIKEEGKFEIAYPIENNVFLIDQCALPEPAIRIDKLDNGYDANEGINIDIGELLHSKHHTVTIGSVCKVSIGLDYAYGYIYLDKFNKLACYTNSKFYKVESLDEYGIPVLLNETEPKELHYDFKTKVLLAHRPTTPREIRTMDAILEHSKYLPVDFLQFLLANVKDKYEVEMAVDSFNYGRAQSSNVTID